MWPIGRCGLLDTGNAFDEVNDLNLKTSVGAGIPGIPRSARLRADIAFPARQGRSGRLAASLHPGGRSVMLALIYAASSSCSFWPSWGWGCWVAGTESGAAWLARRGFESFMQRRRPHRRHPRHAQLAGWRRMISDHYLAAKSADGISRCRILPARLLGGRLSSSTLRASASRSP